HAHLGLEEYARLRVHRRAHHRDQLLDVARPRVTPGIDDEVRVLFRYARAADRASLEPACLDEPRRVITLRIAEYAARIRQLQRLCRDAPLQEGANAFARLFAVACGKVEPRGGEDAVRRR